MSQWIITLTVLRDIFITANLLSNCYLYALWCQHSAQKNDITDSLVQIGTWETSDVTQSLTKNNTTIICSISSANQQLHSNYTFLINYLSTLRPRCYKLYKENPVQTQLPNSFPLRDYNTLDLEAPDIYQILNSCGSVYSGELNSSMIAHGKNLLATPKTLNLQ